MYNNEINTKSYTYSLTPKTTRLLFLNNIALYGNTIFGLPVVRYRLRMNESSSRVIVSNKTGTPTVTVAAELCKYPINTLRTMNSDRNSSYFF